MFSIVSQSQPAALPNFSFLKHNALTNTYFKIFEQWAQQTYYQQKLVSKLTCNISCVNMELRVQTVPNAVGNLSTVTKGGLWPSKTVAF